MIKLQYGRLFRDGLDQVHGLRRDRLSDLARRFAEVQSEVERRRAAGEYGFYKLVDQGPTVRAIRTFAEGLGQAHDHVLVLGIGGSALGTKALLNALRPPAWNELDDEGRDFFPRLTVLENVDPTSVSAALDRIDPRRVLVNVISKSGGTAETMAQYLIVRSWLERALGAAASRHFVFTTDPERGALRELAQRDHIATLDVPPEVGRFSVLSPVGLLPAALVGIDVEGLLKGARGALERAESGEQRTIQRRSTPHSSAKRIPRRMPGCMSSCPTLTGYGSWLSGSGSSGPRAWASGRAGKTVHVGPTPVAGRGCDRPAQSGSALHGGTLR